MSLRLESVSHRFGRQQVLSDVNVEIQRGDCYGFLGHNGAGKTTSMRVALGLLRPDRGRVLVDGFDARQHPLEARVRMGGLIEIPGFHGHLDGRRNLMAFARLQGISARDARAEAERLLDVVGLGEIDRRPVRAYSHGMRQRLGLAQALLGSPRYLLLDEPISGLDPEGIVEIREVLRQLREAAHVTLLISSHQIGELASLCTRIGVIRKGRLLVEGPITELLASDDQRYEIAADPAELARQTLAELGLAAPAAEEASWQVQLGERSPGDVARRLVERGCAVRVFAPRPPSLEEIYLRYTRESPDSPDAPAREAATPAPSDAPPNPRLAPRRPVWRVFRYDASRWLRQIGVWLLLVAPAVVAGAAILRRQGLIEQDLSEIASQDLIGSSQVTAFEGVGIGLQAGLTALVFIALGFASQSIASERSRGTLVTAMIRPARRWHFAVGKALSAVGAVAFSYLLLLGVSWGLSAYLFEFGSMTEILPNGEVYEYLSADQLWPELQGVIAAPLIPLLAYLAIGFACGAALRSGATALTLALSLGVVLALLPFGARNSFETWLPSAHLPSLLTDTSALSYYLDAVTGVGNPDVYDGGAFGLGPGFDAVINVPMIWSVVGFSLATWLIVRRPVT